jgi:hypothetical protein
MVAMIANALRSIASSVGITIAGVTANQAPVTGPAAVAEGIAAGGLVQAAALGAMNIASFDVGAWSVPRTGLALVHEGEFIPPAGPASDFARAAFNGGSGANGGDTHLHFNISALDGASVQRIAPKIAAALQDVYSKNRELRPAY